jgi:hypothetical protein
MTEVERLIAALAEAHAQIHTLVVKERNELCAVVERLTNEREELRTKIIHLTTEREELYTRIIHLTTDRDGLKVELENRAIVWDKTALENSELRARVKETTDAAETLKHLRNYVSVLRPKPKK